MAQKFSIAKKHRVKATASPQATSPAQSQSQIQSPAQPQGPSQLAKRNVLLVGALFLSALVHAVVFGLSYWSPQQKAPTALSLEQQDKSQPTRQTIDVMWHSVDSKGTSQKEALKAAARQKSGAQKHVADRVRQKPGAEKVQVAGEASSLNFLRPTSLAQGLAQSLDWKRAPSADRSRQPSSLPAHLSLASPSLQKTQDLNQLLTAKEFKYASYYLRMRQQLAAAWWPRVQKVIDMYIMGDQKALLQHRTTKARVVLNPKGQLINLQLLKSSGLTTADRAAQQALRAAAPFPNPPAELMGSEKQLPLVWHFVIHP